VTLSHTPFCVVSPKEKEKKKKRKVNINNDLAILPSHDNQDQENRVSTELHCNYSGRKLDLGEEG